MERSRLAVFNYTITKFSNYKIKEDSYGDNQSPRS